MKDAARSASPLNRRNSSGGGSSASQSASFRQQSFRSKSPEPTHSFLRRSVSQMEKEKQLMLLDTSKDEALEAAQVEVDGLETALVLYHRTCQPHPAPSTRFSTLAPILVTG